MKSTNTNLECSSDGEDDVAVASNRDDQLLEVDVKHAGLGSGSRESGGVRHAADACSGHGGVRRHGRGGREDAWRIRGGVRRRSDLVDA
jgi:hypothetical protein